MYCVLLDAGGDEVEWEVNEAKGNSRWTQQRPNLLSPGHHQSATDTLVRRELVPGKHLVPVLRPPTSDDISGKLMVIINFLRARLLCFFVIHAVFSGI